MLSAVFNEGTTLTMQIRNKPSFWLVLAGLMMTITIACSQGDDAARPQAVTSRIDLSAAFTGTYALTDMHGTPTTQDRFAGKPTFIYFGFTACPDVCPAALGVMSVMLDELGDDAEKLQPLFIAVDPARDTPEVLRSYLGFDPRILGLTGDAAAMETAKDAFKVYASRQDLPESALGYTINHSSLFYFVDETGTPKYAFKDNLTPQALAAEIKRLL
ncbi:MAG: SCO family protein [Pseudomonadota bacterium]